MPVYEVHLRTCRTPERHRSRTICREATHQIHSSAGSQQSDTEKRQDRFIASLLRSTIKGIRTENIENSQESHPVAYD